MADYRSDTTVAADAGAVFDFLSDVRNLPRYFERMTSAVPGDGDEVEVSADLGDRQVVGQAWFRVDRDAQKLEWGSEGPNDYHGSLAVTAMDDGTHVVVTLSTARVAGPEIQQGLDDTMSTVARLSEDL